MTRTRLYVVGLACTAGGAATVASAITLPPSTCQQLVADLCEGFTYIQHTAGRMAYASKEMAERYMGATEDDDDEAPCGVAQIAGHVSLLAVVNSSKLFARWPQETQGAS